MALPGKLTIPWDFVNVNRNAIPIASQIGTTDGAASLTDGFPPLCLQPVSSGGVPPSGKDMNGILYEITNLLVAWNQGLIAFPRDATFQGLIGGYPVGAVLQQAADPTAFWISNVAANVTNPDAAGAGWISTKPLPGALVPSAGAHNNAVLPGPSDYVITVDTTAGATNYTGFVAQRDGQRITFVVTGASNFTLSALNGGSAAANRIQLSGDLATIQNDSITIQYSLALTKWVQA